MVAIGVFASTPASVGAPSSAVAPVTTGKPATPLEPSAVRTSAVLPARAWRVSDGFMGGPIHAMAPSTRGGLWVAGFNGVQHFDGVRFQDIAVNVALPKAQFPRVYWVFERDGFLYLKWNDAIVRVDLTAGQALMASPGGWDAISEERVSRTPTWVCHADNTVWVIEDIGGAKPRARLVDLHSGKMAPPLKSSFSGVVTYGACTAEEFYWQTAAPFGVGILNAGTDTVRTFALDGLQARLGVSLRSSFALRPPASGPDAREELSLVFVDTVGLALVRLRDGKVSRAAWSTSTKHTLLGVYTAPPPNRGDKALRHGWVVTSGPQVLEVDLDTLALVAVHDLRNAPQTSFFAGQPVPNFAIRLPGLASTQLWAANSTSLMQINAVEVAAVSQTVTPEDRSRYGPGMYRACAQPNGALWSAMEQDFWLARPAMRDLSARAAGGRQQAVVGTLPVESFSRVLGPLFAGMQTFCDVEAAGGDDDLAATGGAEAWRGAFWLVQRPSTLVRLSAGPDGQVKRRELKLPMEIARAGGVVAVRGDHVWLTGGGMLYRVGLRHGDLQLQVAAPGLNNNVRPRVVPDTGVGDMLLYGDHEGDIRAVELQAPGANVAVPLPDGKRLRSLVAILVEPNEGVHLLTSSGELFHSKNVRQFDFAALGRLKAPPKLGFYCMLPGPNRQLWFGTTDGLLALDRYTNVTRRLTTPDGVMWADINRFTCTQLGDGRLFFGSSEGWTVVSPERVQAPERSPAPHVTALKLGDQPERAWFSANLPPLTIYQPNDLIELQFGLSGMLAGAQGRIRYKLDGYDRDWREAPIGQVIQYINLPSFNSTLTVMATLNDAPWSESIALPVSVVPPWHRSTLAYSIFLSLGAAIALAWLWRRRQQRRERESYLRTIERSEERMQTALTATGAAIWEHDVTRDRVYRSHIAWLGPLNEQLNGESHELDAYVHPADLAKFSALRNGIREAKGAGDFEAEYRMRSHWGDWVWVHDFGRVVESRAAGSGERRVTGMMRNITAIRQVEDELLRQASQDALTGLANRHVFHERMREHISHIDGQSNSDERLVLLHIDLDQFRHINDAFGHTIGDQILRQYAKQLTKAAEAVAEGGVEVFRIGGDVFCALQRTTGDAQHTVRQAQALAQRVLAFSPSTDDIEGIGVVITSSVGIALYPEHAASQIELQRAADEALAEAKRSGRNTSAVFAGNRLSSAVEWLQIETALRSAIANDELYLVYQPKLNLRDQHCHGVEALLRWKHPAWGSKPIDQLIHILEVSGLIHEVGLWVLRTALQDLIKLRQQGIALQYVAVNLSSLQLYRKDFVEQVGRVLQDTGATPALLEIEITESVAVTEDAAVRESLDALRAMGMRLAIDDFGKGYSSLGYLKRLPVDTIKVDRVFVTQIEHDLDAQRFLRAILDLLGQLGVTIDVEGVETPEQQRLIESMRCDQLQGWVYARPMPFDELASWLVRARATGKA